MNAHIIKLFLLIEWFYSKNLFFRHPSRCCCFLDVWRIDEVNKSACESKKTSSQAGGTPAQCVSDGGRSRTSFSHGSSSPFLRPGNQSPTLISHLEVNCSLICNFFVRKKENARSVYRFSGLWPAATHFDFLISSAKGEAMRVVPFQGATWEISCAFSGRAVIITKARPMIIHRKLWNVSKQQ